VVHVQALSIPWNVFLIINAFSLSLISFPYLPTPITGCVTTQQRESPSDFFELSQQLRLRAPFLLFLLPSISFLLSGISTLNGTILPAFAASAVMLLGSLSGWDRMKLPSVFNFSNS
jgi:hypothetical protein